MDLITVAGIAGPTALFTAGIAWGAVRQSLNGTRQNVREIKLDLSKHLDDDARVQRDLLQRAASLEAKADLIITKLGDKQT